MKENLSDFDYHLPENLIAQHPLSDRTKSRLMCLKRHERTLAHHAFYELPDFLQPGDLLVFNESKVIPARFFGKKPSGGKVEFLIERILDSQIALTHIKSNRTIQPDTEILLDQGDCVWVEGREDSLFKVHLKSDKDWLSLLNGIGQIPLPPYIKRAPEEKDTDRYQTVYAHHPGSVAAPTAGLHFDQNLMDRLSEKGIQFAFVNLHVGAGTFQPVKVEKIKEHKIHEEWMEVNQFVCDQIVNTKKVGGRVIAVGTTSARSLESAALKGKIIQPYKGPTELFIYPGFEFKCIDGLITNFHLPKSSLLMLVSAFMGYEPMFHAYHEAVRSEYRFFSYGDAMLICPST